jgi:transcription initiation factor IIE alpha subunit
MTTECAEYTFEILINYECPDCGYRYSAHPGVNENVDCHRCGTPCDYVGESYISDQYPEDWR